MKKLMVFAVVIVATISMSFAQTKMTKEAPTMSKERTTKTKKIDKIKAAMESAGVSLNPDQVTRLESTYKAQREKIKAIRSDENLDEAARKEVMKEVKESTKNEISSFLSADQVAVLGKMKKERRGNVSPIRSNRDKVDFATKADNKLAKMTTTLESAGVPLNKAQTADLTVLFNDEAKALEAAKTQSRSEMGVKDIRKTIRTEYREKARNMLTKEQSKALKATRKQSKAKL